MEPLLSKATLKYYFAGIYNRAADNHLFLFAGGIAFSVLLSLIPFSLLVFSVLGHLLDSGAVQDQINGYIGALIQQPEMAAVVMRFVGRRIEEFIAFKGIAGILGAAGLLFFASSLFTNMKTALNKIYRVSDETHPVVGILWDMVRVLLVIIFLALLVLIMPALEGVKDITFRRDAPVWAALEIVRSGLFYVISLAFVYVVFYALYRFAPAVFTDHRRAAISALWATILWELAKQVFGYYITHFITLKQIYGAYLLLVAVALWLYYSSLVFIVAAEIAQLASERGVSRWAKLRAYLSQRKFGFHGRGQPGI